MHDDLAGHYDAMFDDLYGDTYRMSTEALLEILQSFHAPPARVLDVGAGTGRVALSMAAAGYAVTAVEPSRGMRARLTEKAAAAACEIDLRAGVLPDALTPADRGFALAVLACGVIDYLVDNTAAETALRAIAARMAPGGVCVIQPADKSFMRSGVETGAHYRREVDLNWQGEVAHFVHRVLLDGQQVAEETLSLRYRPPNVLEDLCQRAGWQLLEETSDGAYPTWVLGLRQAAAD